MNGSLREDRGHVKLSYCSYRRILYNRLLVSTDISYVRLGTSSWAYEGWQPTRTLAAAEKSFRHSRTSMACTSGTSPVCLVYLVSLVSLVHLVYPVSLVQPNKQDKPNKPIKRDRPDRPDRPNEQDRLADFSHTQLGSLTPSFHFVSLNSRRVATE
jgi:hypothetical protein